MSKDSRETVRTLDGKVELPSLPQIPKLAGEGSILANRHQTLNVLAQVSFEDKMAEALVKETNAYLVSQAGRDKAFLAQKGITCSVPKEIVNDMAWIYYAHLAEVNGIRVHRANKVEYPLWMWRIITPIMKHTVGGTTITPSFTAEAWNKYIETTKSGTYVMKERENEAAVLNWYKTAGIELVQALPRAYEVKDGTFGIFELEVDKTQGLIVKYNNLHYPNIMDTYAILFTKVHGFKIASEETGMNLDEMPFVFQTTVNENMGVPPETYAKLKDAKVRLDIKFYPYDLRDVANMMRDEAKMCIAGTLKVVGDSSKPKGNNDNKDVNGPQQGSGDPLGN